MADEVNASFMLPGAPAANVASWRATPPAFLADAGFKRTDESYESLVYEANVTTTFVKLSTFGFGKTLYRLAFTFRAAQDATQVTVLGQANEGTRTEMAQWTVANSGV
jgi:hypothetical protein